MSPRAQVTTVKDSRWVEFLYEVRGRDDNFHARSISVTPYYCYGQVAGYVVTVDGTPPRITALVPATWTSAIVFAPPPGVLEPGTPSFDRMLGFFKRHGIRA